MKYTVFLAFACSLLTLPVQANAQDYTFEKVSGIALKLDDDIIGQVADLALDADGRFFLADDRQHTIWVVESSGVVSHRIGREGAGPGELDRPLGVAISDEKVVVLDSGNNRVSIFSKDGKHISDFRIENMLPPSGLLSTNDGQIAVSSVWDEPNITVYDMDGSLKREIGKIVLGGKPIRPMTINFHHVSKTPDGLILYSSVKRYDVFRLRWDGTILNTYRAEPDGFHPFPDPPPTGRFRTTPLFRPLQASGHVVVQRSGETPAGEFGRFGDLFTEEGAIVQLGIDLPLVFFYSNGREFYGVDATPVDEGEDNPDIVVYRLSGGP